MGRVSVAEIMEMANSFLGALNSDQFLQDVATCVLDKCGAGIAMRISPKSANSY